MTATTVPAAVPAALPVDLGLYPDIRRFGAGDVSACFSCGTCTASCPLSQDDGAFPRRMIRYAQLGMKDALLSSKELWSCYQCGECAETCPTQADPSEFMAATRRYAIASYDRTRIARTMYTQPILAMVIAVALAVLFALFMMTARGPQSSESLALFEFIPAELIHDLGIGVMVVVVIAGLAGIVSMARRIGKREGVGLADVVGGRKALARSGRAAWGAIGREAVGQVQFRKECDADVVAVPWFRRRGFVHAVTVWGFLGLLAATGLDWGLALAGIKETGTPVPLWYPARLLGTVA
ncbi:MAG: 4Fe-4S dicluster domain-containing protein, partial [Chloroflexi bacterium]|nr:4Fe-4S dicluster domain-containing protein [Chloroflexota bacterium]